MLSYDNENNIQTYDMSPLKIRVPDHARFSSASVEGKEPEKTIPLLKLFRETVRGHIDIDPMAIKSIEKIEALKKNMGQDFVQKMLLRNVVLVNLDISNQHHRWLLQQICGESGYSLNHEFTKQNIKLPTDIIDSIKKGHPTTVHVADEDKEIVEGAMRMLREDMVLDLIRMGLGAWVIDQLKDIHFRLEDSGHFVILSCLAANRHARWVAEKLDSPSFDFSEPTHILLLEQLLENGQTEWFVQKFNDISFDTTKGNQTTLIRELINRGQSAFIKTKFEDVHFDLTNAYHRGILDALILNGEVKWVIEKIADQPLDIKDKQLQELIINLSAAGGEDIVFEKICNQDFTDTENENRILTKFIQKGKADWAIKKLKKNKNFDPSEKKFHKITQALLEQGEDDFIIKKFEDSLTYLHTYNADQMWFANQMIARGHKEWIKSVISFWDHEEFQNDIEFPLHAQSGEEKKLQASLDAYAKTKWEGILGSYHTAVQEVGDSLPKKFLLQFEKRLQDIKEVLPSYAIPILQLAVRKHGWFSHHILRALDAIQYGSASFVLDIFKSGSKLQVIGKPIKEKMSDHTTFNIGFVNDIPSRSAQAWEKAHSNEVPVAPIIKKSRRISESTTREYSRFCGMNLGDTYDLRLPNWFRHDLQMLQANLPTLFAQKGVSHGSLNAGNIAVEYVRRDWLEKKRAEGYTINTFPLDAHAVSFDPVVFVKNPSDWIPIMRAIDLDRSREV